MSYYKAVFNFNRTIEDKAPEERDIHSKMYNLALFGDPPIPYADFLLAINEQQVAVDNAQNGGRSQIALMRTKERIVDDMVRKFRNYVSDVADGDTDIILSSGFRHTKARSSAGDMPKVEAVRRLNTEISAALKLRWKRVKNVGFYEVDVRLIEPLKTSPGPIPVPPIPPIPPISGGGDTGRGTGSDIVEERPWVTRATKPANIEIKDLKPLSQYEVRVRAKGTKGYGGYSDVVIMIVT
ncbi:MAG: fibronectin type III domain-containing protein [Flavobacteriales bacterium]|nr:fibronectin type III domain-containing protein [Flavobacteriales bacterium]